MMSEVFNERRFSPVSYFLLILASTYSLMKVAAFNVGTSGANIIRGPKGSNFGATLNFSPIERNGNIMLAVGAPQEDSAGQLGMVHECINVWNQGSSCSSFRLDDQTSIDNATKNEKFGSAVALNERGYYVICSPQWEDTTVVQYFYTFMPGRCSVLFSQGQQREYKPCYAAGNNIKYVKTIDGITMYIDGTAAFGLSVDINHDHHFVSGAPNVLEGEGIVVLTDMSNNEEVKSPLKLEYNFDTRAYGYLGYDVKFGRFCNDTSICFAASAPNLNRVGMVKIFRRGQDSTGQHALQVVQLIPGQQAWSYFGYAIAACDVTRDSLDELLVGAPHHSDTSDDTNGFDQGAVYVYGRLNPQDVLQRRTVLSGNSAKFARFGAAVQCVGDFNLDEYRDVVVGAPGENEGRGSIYIYLGSPGGLKSTASQRIAASQLQGGINGFGYAISGSQHIQGSMYPIFAVSSVEDDTVVVLQSRPIVDTTISLIATPNPVDLQTRCSIFPHPGACFSVKLCLSGRVRGGGTLKARYVASLEIDTGIKTEEWKRAMFKPSTSETNSSLSDIVFNLQCKEYYGVIYENQVNQDRFSPVFIAAKYELETDPSDNLAPVLNAEVPQNLTVTLTFQNDCGANNVCDVDLAVRGSLSYIGNEQEWNSIIVNETNELLVDLVISNSKETNYWTVVEIIVDSPLPYSRPTPTSDAAVICSQEETTSGRKETKVICNFYKPFEAGKTISVGAAFNTYHMPLGENVVNVKAKVMPKENQSTKETKLEDNTVDLQTNVRIEADVRIVGTPTPSELTLQEAKRISLESKADISQGYTVPTNQPKELRVTHRFFVQNDGPSFLLPTVVLVNVPVVLQDASLLVHKSSVTLTTAMGKKSECSGLKNFDNVGGVVERTTTPSTSGGGGGGGSGGGGDNIGGGIDIGINGGIDSGTAGGGDNGDSDGITTTTTTTTTTPSTTANSGLPKPPINRRRRRQASGARYRRSVQKELEDAAQSSVIYLQSCQLDPQYCQVFECHMQEGLAADSHAEVNVSLVLDKSNIPIPKDFDSYYYVITAEVKQPKHPLFPEWETPRIESSVTRFHLIETGGKINIWIIIGSVIGGLLFITLIALILWKTGFFKRDKHQQVAQWKRESIRRSRYSSGGKQAGGEK